MNKDRNRIIFYIVSSIVCGFILPWLCNLFKVKIVFKIVIVLFIINLVYSFVFGIMLARYHDSLWYQLLLPCIFAVTTFVMKLNAHVYAYFLAIVYLFVSYLGYLSFIGINKKER